MVAVTPNASKKAQAKAAGVGARTVARARKEASVPSGAAASDGADRAPEVLKLRRLKLARTKLQKAVAKTVKVSKRTAQRARQEATKEGTVARKRTAFDKAKVVVKAKPKASKKEQAKLAGVGAATIDRARSASSGSSASNDAAPGVLKLRRLKLKWTKLIADVDKAEKVALKGQGAPNFSSRRGGRRARCRFWPTGDATWATSVYV